MKLDEKGKEEDQNVSGLDEDYREVQRSERELGNMMQDIYWTYEPVGVYKLYIHPDQNTQSKTTLTLTDSNENLCTCATSA